MNNEDELQAARIELSDLQDHAAELENDLTAAIESADPENMIRLQDAIRRKNIFIYAAESKMLRLSKRLDEQDRNVALYEKQILEGELEVATRTFEDRLRKADEARYAMNLIQAKLFAVDGRITTDRENINSKHQKLMRHVALFKEQSTKPLEARNE